MNAQHIQSFETLARQTVASTFEGSATPFRDAIANAFNLAGNSIATADALISGLRYYAEDWKHESASEFITKSIRLDTKSNEISLMAQLRAEELNKAKQTQ